MTAPKDGPLRGLRFIVALVLFLLALGLIADLVTGLPVLRSSRSWAAPALGIVALGIIALVGEAIGVWISGRDKVSDPLWKRVWHLAMLLTFALLLAIAFGAVERIVQ